MKKTERILLVGAIIVSGSVLNGCSQQTQGVYKQPPLQPVVSTTQPSIPSVTVIQNGLGDRMIIAIPKARQHVKPKVRPVPRPPARRPVVKHKHKAKPQVRRPAPRPAKKVQPRRPAPKVQRPRVQRPKVQPRRPVPRPPARVIPANKLKALPRPKRPTARDLKPSKLSPKLLCPAMERICRGGSIAKQVTQNKTCRMACPEDK